MARVPKVIKDTLNGNGMTAQQRYQARHKVKGLCVLCRRKAVEWDRCAKHLRNAAQQSKLNYKRRKQFGKQQ